MYKIATPVKIKEDVVSRYWYVLSNGGKEIVARCNTKVDAQQIAEAVNNQAALAARVKELEAALNKAQNSLIIFKDEVVANDMIVPLWVNDLLDEIEILNGGAS
jgi:hypothetical protein